MKNTSQNHGGVQLTKSILKEEEVKNNKLSKGKVAIEQISQESLKALCKGNKIQTI